MKMNKRLMRAYKEKRAEPLRVNKRLMRVKRQNREAVREIFETARNQSIFMDKDYARYRILKYDSTGFIRGLSLGAIHLIAALGGFVITPLDNPSGGLTLMDGIILSAGLILNSANTIYYAKRYNKDTDGYDAARQSALDNMATKRSLETAIWK